MMPFAELVAAVLEIRAEDIKDDVTPEACGSWSSLRHLQLVTALEDNYGIRFSRGEIQGFGSIGAIRRTLGGKGFEV
ncbi:acyl carrier protein [Streptomyces sp. NPDC050287]|uniref:acyl carrier protein n=1 Tax=Streptomyces sp. NPDC050287 TaxID=3365608 RepID=UPI0037A2E770